MAILNISLPDALQGFVDKRVATGGFSSSSDYVRELIRHDQEALQQFRELIQEGLDSPLEGPVDQAFFERLHERIQRHARRG